jgi:hypothetical protein
MTRCGSTHCKSKLFFSLSYFTAYKYFCRFRRKRFNWPETGPFEWESESECDGELKKQMCFTLPDTQSTDGLTPVRLFQIFEVVKSI